MFSTYILHQCRHLHSGEHDLGVIGDNEGVRLAGFDTSQKSEQGNIQVPYDQLGWLINALIAVRDERNYDPDSLDSSVPFD